MAILKIVIQTANERSYLFRQIISLGSFKPDRAAKDEFVFEAFECMSKRGSFRNFSIERDVIPFFRNVNFISVIELGCFKNSSFELEKNSLSL